MKSERDHPITIEDLLRLKRAERPPAEFWTTFDRELRAKQLSALVGKRPWWQNFPKAFPRLFRYRIPLGASAVVALALISLRHDRAPAVQPAVPSETASAAVVEIASVPVVTAAPVVQELVAAKPAERTLVAASEPVGEVTLEAAAIPETSSVSRPAIALGGGMKIDRVVTSPSPSAVEIASNLAGIRASESAVSRTLLAQNHGFEARPVATHAAVEPLQQMTPPGDSRRSRFLTAMVAAASSESSYRATERAASRIADERLYDQNQRLHARGDRVNLKF
jgi:hypothetical protein